MAKKKQAQIPFQYGSEIREEVLDRLRSGETMVRICGDPRMPAPGTVRKWGYKDPEWQKLYHEAIREGRKREYQGRVEEKRGTLDEIRARIEAYFRQYREEGRPLTISGLCVCLGCYEEESLWAICRVGDDHANLIKSAIAQVRQAYEERLYSASSTGAIFALKHLGWKDTQYVEHGGSIDVRGAKERLMAMIERRNVDHDQPSETTH